MAIKNWGVSGNRVRDSSTSLLFLSWIKALIPPSRAYWVFLPPTVLIAAHLVAVGLFPGGYNPVLNLRVKSGLAYLSHFPAIDPLALPIQEETTQFLLYKIHTQGGDSLEGTLPDPKVRPWLRHARWASAGFFSARPVKDLHASLVKYLVSRLPEPPLKVEVFSARWVWDHNKYMLPWRGFNRDNALELHLMGTYNGLTRSWQPANQGGNQ